MDLSKYFLLFFKLLPFIIVCYFILFSLFFFDLKGIIYLTGLLITCLITIIIGKVGGVEYNNNNNNDGACKLLDLTTGNNNEPLSPIALNIVSLAFLLGYYTTILSKHQNKKSNYRFTNNAFSYIILLGVILTYFYWYYSMSKCSDWSSAMTPIIIGGIGGALWSIFIMETNISQLQYFNGISSAEVCSMPTKKMYRCTIR